MENQIPKPLHGPSQPQSGWWKAPASLATDPVFLRVSDEHRLGAVATYTALIGWCLTHNSKEGWVPAPAISYGQVLAAPREQLEAATAALVEAGILTPVDLGGVPGYVVAGAAKAVEERYNRQASAANAGKTSAENKKAANQGQSRNAVTLDRYGRKRFDPDANTDLDWSTISEEL